jgi:hypothetical protein
MRPVRCYKAKAETPKLQAARYFHWFQAAVKIFRASVALLLTHAGASYEEMSLPSSSLEASRLGSEETIIQINVTSTLGRGSLLVWFRPHACHMLAEPFVG